MKVSKSIINKADKVIYLNGETVSKATGFSNIALIIAEKMIEIHGFYACNYDNENILIIKNSEK